MRPTCRSNRFMTWALAAALGGVVFPVGVLAQAGGRESSATPPPTSATVIRVARSQDGITFADTGEVLPPGEKGELVGMYLHNYARLCRTCFSETEGNNKCKCRNLS